MSSEDKRFLSFLDGSMSSEERVLFEKERSSSQQLNAEFRAYKQVYDLVHRVENKPQEENTAAVERIMQEINKAKVEVSLRSSSDRFASISLGAAAILLFAMLWGFPEPEWQEGYIDLLLRDPQFAKFVTIILEFSQGIYGTFLMLFSGIMGFALIFLKRFRIAFVLLLLAFTTFSVRSLSASFINSSALKVNALCGSDEKGCN